MKCEELLAILNEYVDGEVDPGVCDEYREHIDSCNPCQVVVDNIRRTILLYKGSEVFELDPNFRKSLHGQLERRWREKRKGP